MGLRRQFAPRDAVDSEADKMVWKCRGCEQRREWIKQKTENFLRHVTITRPPRRLTDEQIAELNKKLDEQRKRLTG